jgi:hypothetical protein
VQSFDLPLEITDPADAISTSSVVSDSAVLISRWRLRTQQTLLAQGQLCPIAQSPDLPLKPTADAISTSSTESDSVHANGNNS